MVLLSGPAWIYRLHGFKTPRHEEIQANPLTLRFLKEAQKDAGEPEAHADRSKNILKMYLNTIVLGSIF